MSMMPWRRDPVGAGMKFLAQRQRRALTQPPVNRSITQLSPSDYEDMLREAGASEAMIVKEIRDFKEIKALEIDSKQDISKRKEARRKRQLSNELDPYVEADIRRIAGVVSDEVIETILKERES